MICVLKKGEQYVPSVQLGWHFTHENMNMLPCTKGVLRGDRSLNQEVGKTLCKMADKSETNGKGRNYKKKKQKQPQN